MRPTLGIRYCSHDYDPGNAKHFQIRGYRLSRPVRAEEEPWGRLVTPSQLSTIWGKLC